MKNYSTVILLLFSLFVKAQVNDLSSNAKFSNDSIVIGTTKKEIMELTVKYFKENKFVAAQKNVNKYFDLFKADDSDFKTMESLANILAKEIAEPGTIAKRKREPVDPSKPIIENVPIFPGCVGTEKEKNICLQKSIREFIVQHFDHKKVYCKLFKIVVDQKTNKKNEVCAEEFPANSKVNIFSTFKINKNGAVEIINVKAPNEHLKKETERVLKLLPEITPARQFGKTIDVRYVIPISFVID